MPRLSCTNQYWSRRVKFLDSKHRNSAQCHKNKKWDKKQTAAKAKAHNKGMFAAFKSAGQSLAKRVPSCVWKTTLFYHCWPLSKVPNVPPPNPTPQDEDVFDNVGAPTRSHRACRTWNFSVLAACLQVCGEVVSEDEKTAGVDVMKSSGLWDTMGNVQCWS